MLLSSSEKNKNHIVGMEESFALKHFCFESLWNAPFFRTASSCLAGCSKNTRNHLSSSKLHWILSNDPDLPRKHHQIKRISFLSLHAFLCILFTSTRSDFLDRWMLPRHPLIQMKLFSYRQALESESSTGI